MHPPEHYLPCEFLRTMDNIEFYYKPPLASCKQQPFPSGLVTTSNSLERPAAAPSVRQDTSLLNQQYRIARNQPIGSQDMSNLFQERHASDQQGRNDTFQKQGMCRDLL
jgi:hypothetical protein